jgi:hypothetical protein
LSSSSVAPGPHTLSRASQSRKQRSFVPPQRVPPSLCGERGAASSTDGHGWRVHAHLRELEHELRRILQNIYSKLLFSFFQKRCVWGRRGRDDLQHQATAEAVRKRPNRSMPRGTLQGHITSKYKLLYCSSTSSRSVPHPRSCSDDLVYFGAHLLRRSLHASALRKSSKGISAAATARPQGYGGWGCLVHRSVVSANCTDTAMPRAPHHTLTAVAVYWDVKVHFQAAYFRCSRPEPGDHPELAEIRLVTLAGSRSQVNLLKLHAAACHEGGCI